MRTLVKSALVAVSAAPLAAFAALPDGVTTGITSTQTDGLTLIGALAGFGTALWLIAKVLKKFGVMG